MTSWSASSLALLLALAGPAQAASPEAAMACLAAVDLPCARAESDALLAEDGRSALYLHVAAEVAFQEGRYEEAVQRLERAAALHPQIAADVESTLAQYRATRAAAADFSELRRGEVVVRYVPGMDAVLLDEAVEALEAARAALQVQLGTLPPQPVLLEVYPTGRGFVAASGLGDQAVATTGTIAISKWARLIVTSPRAVAGGYSWKDTVVHEYVHQVVSHVSGDRAPLWLQEGVARALQDCWRGVIDPPLDPFEQAALARALAADDLVTFEEMHPSFAFLPSAERGAVAYAQVQVLVGTAMRRGGEGTLPRALAAIRAGAEGDVALAEAAGYRDFATLLAEAEQAMRGLELVERRLAALPVVLDGGGGELSTDPLLDEEAETGGHARLGDLLREAGRPRAALAEYAQATVPDQPESPAVAGHAAACHQALGDTAAARALLERSTRDYPGYAPTWRALGELREAGGEQPGALAAFRAAADVDPFDPETQGQLARLYGAAGKQDLAARHAGYEKLLRQGGVVVGE
jgi:tetratricopeptide (TPR) repeat protein